MIRGVKLWLREESICDYGRSQVVIRGGIKT